MQQSRPLNKAREEDTIAECNLLIAANSSDIGAYYKKVKALLTLDRKKDALAAYDKIIKTAFLDKGLILEELGQKEVAIAAYDKVIEIDPESEIAYENKAQILRSLGKFEAAIAVYDKVIELDPNDPSAYNTKGECLMELGNFKEAVKAYDEVIRLIPNESLGYGNKGFALYHLGELEEAIKCYDKEGEIEYDWLVDAKKGKALIDLDYISEGMEHIQKAMDNFKKGKLEGNCFTDENGKESVYNILEVALLRDLEKLLI